MRLKPSDWQITLLYASSFPFARLLGFIEISVERHLQKSSEVFIFARITKHEVANSALNH